MKRDGNCFYRAFAFAIAEYMTTHKDSNESKRISKLLSESKTFLTQFGYDLIAVEEFYDSTIELLVCHDLIEALEVAFEEGYASEAVVCYLRLIAAAMLKSNAEFYSMFVEIDLDSFIGTQVEPSKF